MSKFHILLNSLQTYYRSNPRALRIFLEIVSNRSTVVSLRLMDWLVTNFVTSKFESESPETRSKRLNLYFNYVRNLDSYTKVWFDPFARKATDKGSFKFWLHTTTCDVIHSDQEVPDGEPYISTTVGQLNFFRIAIEEGYVSYAFENHTSIQTHMLEGLAERKRSKVNARRDVFRPVDSETGEKITIAYRAEPLGVSTFEHDPTVHITMV